MIHNKKRNTAFLFEALIKEQVECVLKKKDRSAKLIEKTIKKFFAPTTLLSKDLELYLALAENQQLSNEIAERLLSETKKEKETIDEKQLFIEQSKLISFINKTIGAHIYEHYIPQYKILATINSIFNKKLPVKHRMIMEQNVKDHLLSSPPSEEVINEQVDMIVFNKFIDNFNLEYNFLIKEQKDLLSKFILYQFGSDIDLKIYMNEECKRIKNVIESKRKQIESLNEETKKSINQCLKNLETINVKHIDDTFIYSLMKYQELANELGNLK